MPLSKDHQNRDKGGKFVESSHPPARQVQVSLPEPFIEALDAYGREHGTGRGRSIVKLFEGVLTPSSPPDPLPVAQRDLVRLELVKSSNPLYQKFRRSHYIPDRGTMGQQFQYLIFYGSEVVGIIGGASAVFANQARDEFFGLAEEAEVKTQQLNNIVNNNVFRLEYPAPNLATIVLSIWRKRIMDDWEKLYGVPITGFETFVVEERLWSGKTRNGACYRADNWVMVGITRGYGKTNARGREIKDKTLRSKKLVYCLRIKGRELCDSYAPAWNDLDLKRDLRKRRDQMLSDPLGIVLDVIRGETWLPLPLLVDGGSSAP